MLLAGSFFVLFPFWVMITTSLLPPEGLGDPAQALWPRELSWQNYPRMLQKAPVFQYFINSLIVSIITTIGHTFLCAMAAYAFSRLKFKGKNLAFFIFLITLMVPPQVNIVPLFFIMKTLHWLDTYWALIVPGLFGAFGVFLLRQWFNTLPRALEDAAKMDGCSPWQTFFYIALPLAKPALATLAIFVFISSWNSFMWPLLATNSEEMRTLPVGIATLKSSYRDVVDWPILMAAAFFSVLPVVVVFLAAQRQFLKGVFSGSIK